MERQNGTTPYLRTEDLDEKAKEIESLDLNRGRPKSWSRVNLIQRLGEYKWAETQNPLVAPLIEAIWLQWGPSPRERCKLLPEPTNRWVTGPVLPREMVSVLQNKVLPYSTGTWQIILSRVPALSKQRESTYKRDSEVSTKCSLGSRDKPCVWLYSIWLNKSANTVWSVHCQSVLSQEFHTSLGKYLSHWKY